MSKIRWAQATFVALAAFIFIGCGGGGSGGGGTTSTTATTGTTSGTTGVAVAISPSDAATVLNGQRTFTATVTGNANTAVSWSVVGSGHGSVSPTGVYTAPGTAGTYTVVATSQADTSKKAQVNVVVGTDAFIHTGDLPGASFASGVQGLNSNGTAVVGFGTPVPPSGQAVTNFATEWKDNTGIVALTNVGAGIAYATTSDGSIIVGVHQVSPSITAFTYTGGVLTDLPNLPGGTNASTAFGISGNGGVIVGQASTSTNATHATKWVGGTATDLGVLSGGSFSLARAVSTDGNTIVGESGQSIGARAVKWVGGGAATSLGVFSGGTESLANGVSSDGSVIVGESGSTAGGTPHTAAFRWTSGGGMVDLGNLGDPSMNASALAVSGDGTIVVGQVQNGIHVGDTDAFIWTQGTGMQSLITVLKNHGMTGPLNNWELKSATCISQDGKVIGGQGKNPAGQPEGWIAILP